MDQTHQGQLFKALNSTIRRSIILELMVQDQPPGFFADVYELSPAAITKHLKILEDASLISRYKQGRERPCTLNLWRINAMKVDWLAKSLL